MARFSRIEVVIKMQESGMIPVFYHKDIEVCKNVIKACYQGGIRIFEFTNRGDFATLLFAELNQWAIQEYPDMILGVGSILDEATTAMYIALGANFIVSPVLDEGMARLCNRRKISWSPGCGSVTEVVKAFELGAEIAKVFPGKEVGGPSFIKTVKGPMPWSSLMPTGGVLPEKDNLKSWFDAGATCVGIGSQLFPKDVIEKKDYQFITKKCAETLAVISEIRK